MNREIVKLRVRVGGIVDSNPPLLAFSKSLTQQEGQRKLHTQRVQVTDPDILARLRSEVDTGDELDIVLETDWSQAEIPTVLKDFSLVRLPVITS
jgi:hypothetical protein